MSNMTFASALAVAATLAVAAPASAATLSFDAEQWADGGTVAFSLDAPAIGTGDAVLTFDVRADLNWWQENVEVFIEGVSLGTVFDGNTSNDAFGVSHDAGYSEFFYSPTASATIDNGTFAGYVADGTLDLSFVFSDKVDVKNRLWKLAGSIHYTETTSSNSEPVTAAVPLPASLPLLALGLGGIAAMRRRKKAS